MSQFVAATVGDVYLLDNDVTAGDITFLIGVWDHHTTRPIAGYVVRQGLLSRVPRAT
jgi:hypothetical protein